MGSPGSHPPINGVQHSAAADWQPDTSTLQHVAALLERSQQPAADQKQVLQALDQQRGSPDFDRCLAYIFAHEERLSEVVCLSCWC
jgi:hypothetical protein